MRFAGLLLLVATGIANGQTVKGAAQLGGFGSVSTPTGTLAISNVSTVATDTTIVASWTTNVYSSPSLACGTTFGTYTITSIDSGIGPPIAHQQIVEGLTPSTAYFCQITATGGTTVTSNFSISTTATPSSTAITGLVLGTANTYNSINVNNQGQGDTFYNCKSNDGTTYMVNDDSGGFTISGVPAHVNGSGAQNVMKVLNESPLTIQTFNPFINYGQTTGLDGLSSKGFGLFCMGGNLFMDIGRQNQNTTQSGGGFAQSRGNIIMSSDHGITWSNPTNVGNFATIQPNPLSSSMWPGSPATMGSAFFVKYPVADDGTLGYLQAGNQHDNGNAFVYLAFNEGVWNGGGSQGGGNALYLARVARAKLSHLSGSDWQFYKGSGSCTADASWSSSESALGAIISNTGEIGTGEIVFVPAKNRYLFLTFYYPGGVTNGGSNLNSTWLGYEAPTPCGPWTQIYSQNFTGAHGGAYNPIILSDTLFSGTTPTVLWTGNFSVPADYSMFYATLTIN